MSFEDGGHAGRQCSSDAAGADRQAGPVAAGVSLANALTPAVHLEPRSFSYIDQKLIEQIERRLRRQSLADIMRTWGISANTWAKLRAGEPVRTSLAERLVERVAASEVQAGKIP